MPDRDIVLAKIGAIQKCIKRIESVTGLTAETLYYYRITATNESCSAESSVTGTVTTVASTEDTTGPTVTINQAVLQDDPTNSAPIEFSVVFNEAVTDFATGDVSLSGTAGATTATVSGSGTSYTVAPVLAADAGTYGILLSNAAGTVGTQAVLTVTGTELPPSITSQPQSQTIALGAPATFSVSASGPPPQRSASTSTCWRRPIAASSSGPTGGRRSCLFGVNYRYLVSFGFRWTRPG